MQRTRDGLLLATAACVVLAFLRGYAIAEASNSKLEDAALAGVDTRTATPRGQGLAAAALP